MCILCSIESVCIVTIHMYVCIVVEELIKTELDQSQAVLKSDPQVSYFHY